MAKGVKTGGRVAGTPNKVTRELREMVLEALDRAGGIDYLMRQAGETPQAFLSLVGRCLPKDMNISGELKLSLEQMILAGVQNQAKVGEQPRH